MSYVIYALKDPRNDAVRYVGKSTKGIERPKEHFRAASLSVKSPKNSWIISLKNKNLSPEIIILEICNKYNLEKKEIFWIDFYKRLGANLTNMTKGGTGGNTGGAHKKHRAVTGIHISTGEIKNYKYIWETVKDGFQPTKVVSVCKKRRVSHKGFYFYYSNEKFLIPVKKTMKPVLCKCKVTGKETLFSSIGEAAQSTGYCITSISNITRGKQRCRKYEFINASHVNEHYQPVNKPIRVIL